MTLISQDSHLALCVVKAMKLVAQSEAFQKRIALYHDEGVETYASAFEHVYDYETFEAHQSQHELRPCAIVEEAEISLLARADCTVPQLAMAGGVTVKLVDTARHADVKAETFDPRNSFIDFLNFLKVHEDMSGLFGAEVDLGAGNEKNWHFKNILPVQMAVRTAIGERGEPGGKNDYWSSLHLWKFGEEK